MNPLKDLATPGKVVESSLTKVVPAHQERHRGISPSDCRFLLSNLGIIVRRWMQLAGLYAERLVTVF